jgi:hypothetical protein
MKQQVKLYKIKGNPLNPRIIKNDKFKKLVASIKEFPEMLKLRPIIVDENMMILGGNMRWKASKEAGLKEVWIDTADGFTPYQKDMFVIKDNVGYGDWEYDILANAWDSVKLTEWGLDVWQNEDDVEDIEEVLDFNEDVNFVIKCSNIEELEKLQSKLNTKAKKIKLDEFLIKSGL